MITDLNTSVTDISAEALDALFDSTPDTTVTADDLTIGKDEDGVATVPRPDGNIPTIDIDSLDDASEEGDEDDEEKETEKPEGNEDGDDGDKPKAKPAPAKAPAKPKEKADESAVDLAVLKNSVDYLIEKGIFKDFEGRENIEMTEDVYAQILEAQVSEMVEERYTSKKSSAGEYGQAILDYLEDGGDPDTIIDLFKERKEITQFDITNEDNQKELVARYYKEVHGWKPERIKKQIEFLANQEDGLETEATEVKAKYDEHYKQQAEALKASQAAEREAYEQEQLRRRQTFETSIKSALKDYEVDDETKQQLEKSLFKFRTLEDGSKVNEFYIKFAEWQKDPKKYVKLVDFVMSDDKYEKRTAIKEGNKAVDKTFKFVKGNQAVSKNTGTKHTDADSEANTKRTDFSVIFKKK